MKVDIHAEGVEVVDGKMCSEGLLSVKYAGWIGCVPPEWCTEVPEPIARGTMVRGWGTDDEIHEPIYGRYYAPCDIPKGHYLVNGAGVRKWRRHVEVVTLEGRR